MSEQRGIPLNDPLLEPPSGVTESLVDPQLDVLPTDLMSWENFERLLLRVAQDVAGLRTVKPFGTRGQAQKGLDLIGVNAEGKAEGIQSKRRQTFTKTHLDDAVKKYTQSTLAVPLARLVIGVATPVAERKVIEHLITLNVALQPLEIEIWDQNRLSDMLRAHPQIVFEFFGAATATRFCLPHTIVPIEVAGSDAVATADAILRGPLTTAKAAEKLQRANEIVDIDPGGALRLFREAQQQLTSAGFPAHAAQFDHQVATLLVTTGDDMAAIRVVLDRLWAAERAGDAGSAAAATRTLRKLAGVTEIGPIPADASPSNALTAAVHIAEFVAGHLHQPVPTTLDLPTAAFEHLALQDQARTVLFAAERALADGNPDWVTQHQTLITPNARDVTSTSSEVAVRLEVVLADVTGSWRALLRRARTTTQRDIGALILARYARYAMWQGDFSEAESAWGEAINQACLAYRHQDAIDWLYSQRFVVMRHQAVLEDRWHPLAQSLSELASRPRLVTSAASTRESALAAIHQDKQRVAAIDLRRYLCDAVRSGALSDEIDARRLLGDVYRASGEYPLAAAHLILAGDVDAARTVARSLGDTYLDVAPFMASPVSWVVATAFEFAAEQGDLIPDDQVEAVVGIALSAIRDVGSGQRPDSPFLSPQIYLSAYALIAELAQRLSPDHGRAVLELLADCVQAEPGHYRRTDDSHTTIAAGIAHSCPDEPLKAQALDQLIALFEREPHLLDSGARDVLTTNLDLVHSRLRGLADGGHRDAKSLLAAADTADIAPADAQAAAARLCAPTRNGPGQYAMGTSAVPDSLLAAALPAAERAPCIRMLLANARSPFEGASNRHSYLLAAANLSSDLDDADRREFFDAAVGFVTSPPRSQPDLLHSSMSNPLSMMRYSGNLDNRPAAGYLAARLAQTAQEKRVTKELIMGLIGVDAEADYDVALALQVLQVDPSELAPILPHVGWALRSVAAIRWVTSPQMPTELGEKLSHDPDARVRRALAQELRARPAEPADQARATLEADQRWSVRHLTKD